MCFLQFGELQSAKQLIFTACFPIWRATKCKIAYIYCDFCNLESYKVPNSLYLLCLFAILRGNYNKKAYNCLDFCNLTSQERACGSWVGRGWVAGGSLFEIFLVKNEHVGRGWVAGDRQTDRQTDDRHEFVAVRPPIQRAQG